jgi:hypothetical protein
LTGAGSSPGGSFDPRARTGLDATRLLLFAQIVTDGKHGTAWRDIRPHFPNSAELVRAMELIGDTRAGASAQAVPFTEVSQIHALYAAHSCRYVAVWFYDLIFGQA